MLEHIKLSESPQFRRFYNLLAKRKQRKKFNGDVYETALRMFSEAFPNEYKLLVEKKQPKQEEKPLTEKQKRIAKGESRLIFGDKRGMKEAHLIKIGDDYVPIEIKKPKKETKVWNI